MSGGSFGNLYSYDGRELVARFMRDAWDLRAVVDDARGENLVHADGEWKDLAATDEEAAALDAAAREISALVAAVPAERVEALRDLFRAIERWKSSDDCADSVREAAIRWQKARELAGLASAANRGEH